MAKPADLTDNAFMASTVLLIHEDQEVVRQIQLACERLEAVFEHAANADDGLDRLQACHPDLVICGREDYDRIHEEDGVLQVVLIAHSASGRETIESMALGALDCLVKPLRVEELTKRLARALRLCQDTRVLATKPVRPISDRATDRMLGQSPAAQEVYRLIGLLAPRHINVLITGESGTGKELVARALVEHSQRRDESFLAVNCAAIPETLLESELFGHEKGAFTGADARRKGRFEECNGGTLFLDEVGDCPVRTQAKLLRVLQDGSFQRLGGNEEVRCDVRILAATHQPLEERIAQKQFREDLYYRLKVATIHVPALREREVDAVLLAHAFVEQLNEQMGTQVRSFSPEVVSTLLAYPWPGNVRELENVIKSAMVVARGPVLRLEHLPLLAQRQQGATGDTETPTTPASQSAGAAAAAVDRLIHSLLRDPSAAGEVYDKAIANVEEALIRVGLEHTRGHLSNLARLLGLSRTTLRQKMRSLGIKTS